jgi:hypothetical protein
MPGPPLVGMPYNEHEFGATYKDYWGIAYEFVTRINDVTLDCQ